MMQNAKLVECSAVTVEKQAVLSHGVDLRRVHAIRQFRSEAPFCAARKVVNNSFHPDSKPYQ